MADISLEGDGIIVCEPQCACDSEDCKKRHKCVLNLPDPTDGTLFPKLRMSLGDETATDPSCYGDCTVVCTSYCKEK